MASVAVTVPSECFLIRPVPVPSIFIAMYAQDRTAGAQPDLLRWLRTFRRAAVVIIALWELWEIIVCQVVLTSDGSTRYAAVVRHCCALVALVLQEKGAYSSMRPMLAMLSRAMLTWAAAVSCRQVDVTFEELASATTTGKAIILLH